MIITSAESGFDLPPVCQGLCMSNVMMQQAAVKGALQRDKELIYHAALLDPNAASSCSPAEIRKIKGIKDGRKTVHNY